MEAAAIPKEQYNAMNTLNEIAIRVIPVKGVNRIAGRADLEIPIEVNGRKIILKAKGFQILRSDPLYAERNQRKYKVFPPAIRTGAGTYKEVFFLEDSEAWNQIEIQITNSLEKELRKMEILNPSHYPNNSNYI
jgi:hypothetical protein